MLNFVESLPHFLAHFSKERNIWRKTDLRAEILYRQSFLEFRENSLSMYTACCAFDFVWCKYFCRRRNEFQPGKNFRRSWNCEWYVYGIWYINSECLTSFLIFHFNFVLKNVKTLSSTELKLWKFARKGMTFKGFSLNRLFMYLHSYERQPFSVSRRSRHFFFASLHTSENFSKFRYFFKVFKEKKNSFSLFRKLVEK